MAQLKSAHTKGRLIVKKTIKCKNTGNGLVEVVDNDTAWGLRYSLVVDGAVKASSNDLQSIIRDYDKR
jgi:hypothetical protein